MSVSQYLELLDKYGINIFHIPTEEQLAATTVEEVEPLLQKLAETFNR